MSRRRPGLLPRLGGLLATCLILMPAASARADNVSVELFRVLAERAAADPAKDADLRAVTAINGTPVEVGAVLGDAEGEELSARAAQLARTIEDPLGEVEPLPEEFAPVLEEPPPEEQPGEADTGSGSGSVFGLPPPLALLAAVAVIAGAALLASRMGARRLPAELGGSATAAGGPAGQREDDWARLADEAERSGDFAAAVRFRYRAGLGSLAAAGALELRPSLTSGEVRRRVFSPRLDRLLTTFESVAYGGRAAEEADAQQARAEWPQAVKEARGA